MAVTLHWFLAGGEESHEPQILMAFEWTSAGMHILTQTLTEALSTRVTLYYVEIDMFKDPKCS